MTATLLETQIKVYEPGKYRELKEVQALAEIGDFVVMITIRERSRPRLRPGSRYITQQQRNEYNRAPRLYFSNDGSETVLENLVNRRNRPYQFYRKEFMPGLTSILRDLGVKILKARWSQKAGCSCGCSPGFILEVADYSNNPYNIWVTFGS